MDEFYDTRGVPSSSILEVVSIVLSYSVLSSYFERRIVFVATASVALIQNARLVVYSNIRLWHLVLLAEIAWYARASSKRRKRADELDSFRTSTFALTAVCILAVDFPSFPRAYAKSHLYGTSLMDVGIGCVVVSSAWTSSKSTRKRLMKSGFCFVLGCLRPLGLWLMNQPPSPAAEYGKHWNFFITLAIVFFVDATTTARWSHVIVCFALVSYAEWNALYTHSSQSFWTENASGIVSTIGCVGLRALVTVWGSPSRATLVGMWLVVAATHESCSRRLVNFQYAWWTLTLACTHREFTSRLRRSATDASLSRNAMMLFMVANVFTGAINRVVETRTFSNASSFFVVATYAWICISIVMLRDSFTQKRNDRL